LIKKEAPGILKETAWIQNETAGIQDKRAGIQRESAWMKKQLESNMEKAQLSQNGSAVPDARCCCS